MNVYAKMEHFLVREWPRFTQQINERLDNIMSQITDFATATNNVLAKISSDVDSIGADITALNAQIAAFNNSPGTLSATDQAALDSISAAATALQNKADALVVPITVTPPATLTGTTSTSTPPTSSP